MKPHQYIDLLAKKLSLNSAPLNDAAVAKALDVTTAAMSRYRKDRNHFDEEVAIRVASLLEMHPGKVMADAAAYRTKCPAAKRAWKQVSRQIGRAAAAVVVVSAMNFQPLTTPVAAASEAWRCLACILC